MIKRFKINSSIVGPLLALILIALLAGFSSKRFWTYSNMNNIILSVSIVAIMAIGATLVVFIGGIDISSGSMIALTTMILATVVKNMGLPLWLGIIATIIGGALLGGINGVLVAYFRIPPFIATLATLNAFKGVAFMFNDGSPIFTLSPGFDKLFYANVFGDIIPTSFSIVPVPLIFVLALYIYFGWMLKYRKLGREIYAVGGNESAAKLSGINVKKVKCMTFIIAGMMTGIASILMAARLNSGSPNYGGGMEMAAIAAAVIGGASLSGGYGYIWSTLIGALTITVVQNALNLHAVPTSLQGLVLGIIIILAVLLDMWKVEIGEFFKKMKVINQKS